MYNFDSIRQNHLGLTSGSIGMLVISKPYRNTAIFRELMFSLFKVLLSTKCDYFIFSLNHECYNIMHRSFGVKTVGEKIWSEKIQHFILPMIMYKEQVINFIKRCESTHTANESHMLV